MITITWTIAYRNPRANRLVRVSGLALTWQAATEAAAALVAARPELDVWYVPTAASDAAWSAPEDRGNVLAPSGRRVRMVEGSYPAGPRPARATYGF